MEAEAIWVGVEVELGGIDMLVRWWYERFCRLGWSV